MYSKVLIEILEYQNVLHHYILYHADGLQCRTIAILNLLETGDFDDKFYSLVTISSTKKTFLQDLVRNLK